MKTSHLLHPRSPIDRLRFEGRPILVGAVSEAGISNSNQAVSSSQPFTRRVLLVEQDLELCRFISRYLSGRGFAVEAVQYGSRALKRALSGEHAIVILNATLPDLQGVEFLRRVRAVSSTPFLLLTARDDAQDRIMGLEMGADDCLPSPFDPRELSARIEAILRRSTSGELEPKRKARRYLVIEDVTLDNGARIAWLSGRKLALTTAEYDLLKAFLESRGHGLSREELVQVVLGRDFSPMDRSIDTHVSHLRKKLGPRPNGLERIKCLRGVGYLYALSPSLEDDASEMRPELELCHGE